MAITFNFAGKQIIEPGSYARIIGGSSAVPPVSAFGKVMLIDTGSNEGFGIGPGINGELAQGKNNIFEFSEVSDFKEFVRGGLFYDLADHLFRPALGGNGVDSIMYVRAGKTTAATTTATVVGSGFTTKSGTITTDVASANVVGNGTFFLTELSVGDIIADDATDTPIGVILTITDDTNLVLAAVASATHNPAIAYSSQLEQPQGGTFTLKTFNEGIGANGILFEGELIKGFGWKLEAGVLDTSKYRFVFYTGNYHGVNSADPNFSVEAWDVATAYGVGALSYSNGLVWTSLTAANTGNLPETNLTDWAIVDTTDNYGGVKPSQAISMAVTASPELNTLGELFEWMDYDTTFKSYFKVVTKTIVGGGKIDDTDLVALSGWQTFGAGTTSYASEDFDEVLDNIAEEDNSFFLMDKWGAAAKNATNTKLLSHIASDSEFEKFVVIGGGHGKDQFQGQDGSLDTAKYYDSAKMICVHGGVKVPSTAGGEKELASIYHAALYLGRTAGLEPQVPSTWKDILISSPVHELSKKERQLALMGGVIHQRYVEGKDWVINQSINTLQRNEVLFLPDGDSYEVSIERIRSQINKELIYNSRIKFVGGNLNTASAEDVKVFTEGYLYSRTVRPNLDNLIMSFRDVKVTLQGDAWKIGYAFVPNSPINKLFFTGVMLDANISI